MGEYCRLFGPRGPRIGVVGPLADETEPLRRAARCVAWWNIAVDGSQTSPSESLHDALVAEGIVVSEGTSDFLSGIAEAMDQLQQRTNEVYKSSPAYRTNLQARMHALPADPDHPLIWEIADKHVQDLTGEPDAVGSKIRSAHEVAQRHFLLRNVLAILAQTPPQKRLLGEQYNVSVIHLADFDSVGLMYWLPGRSRVIVRLRQRNPAVLRPRSASSAGLIGV